MGKVVQVKSSFSAVALPPNWLPFDSGEQTTLTDAEYAALSSATTRALTVVTSGVPDPVRPSAGSLAVPTLKVGAAPQNAFTVEMGQDNDTVNSDLSFVRIRARASRGSNSPTSFYGETALRVEIEDTASVVDDPSTPYLYGVRVRAVPRRGRHVTAVDDLVGVCITNQSFNQLGTSFNGTEAVYIGYGGGSTGGASKDWNAGVGIDTVADNGMYIVRGPYAYGILMTASFTTAAMRIPNNALIVGRNATDTASLNMMKVDTGNNVRLGSGAVKVVVGAPTNDTDPSQPFEVHAAGVTDGTLGRSHQRLVDTTAPAAGVGGTMAFAGYQDATPNIRTFAAVAGRKANGTSGNAAGYLSLYSRNASTGLVEVLRLTELQKVQVTDGVDFTLGTATGTKIGSTTADKLGFWGKAPIAQPTTAFATSAAFVANAGTAINTLSTFDGYTLPQIVAALRARGDLA